MRVLVIYDSVYGNTKSIAEAIFKGFGIPESGAVLNVKEASSERGDIIIVGSPTHGGRPTEGIQKYLDSLNESSINGAYFACFDTRFAEEDQNIGLRILMRAIGYAAEKMSKALIRKGAHIVATPEAFIVTGREGPLRDGEVQRAYEWGKSISDTVTKIREKQSMPLQ